MISYIRRTFFVTAAAAAAFCLAAPVMKLAASSTNAGQVTFSAVGTFATPPLSGADALKMAGQPFTINVGGSSAAIPIQHGDNWAVFKPLTMSGTVESGLFGAVPIGISSSTAAIEQTVGVTQPDIFQSGFPITVSGIALTVRAYISLPPGTLASPYLRPFASVSLDPTNSTVSYSNGVNTTVLAVQTGSVIAHLGK
jgi:hypothetical protein